MTLFDWLQTASGVEFVHALILLSISAAGYLSYLSHQQSVRNSEKLQTHIEEHLTNGTQEH